MTRFASHCLPLGTRLDYHTIRVDWDQGFVEGRQYGRGKHGGQVRDEYQAAKPSDDDRDYEHNQAKFARR